MLVEPLGSDGDGSEHNPDVCVYMGRPEVSCSIELRQGLVIPPAEQGVEHSLVVRPEACQAWRHVAYNHPPVFKPLLQQLTLAGTVELLVDGRLHCLACLPLGSFFQES